MHMDEKKATQKELEATRDKMLMCLAGLRIAETVEVALNVYCFVTTAHRVNAKDAARFVTEYYAARGNKSLSNGNN